MYTEAFVEDSPVTSQMAVTLDQVGRLVDSVDLTMVKRKLMDEDEGQGWDQEYTDFVERRYRRYLCMQIMHPNGPSVPTRDIDLFWHQHILDTRAYARDCQVLFGEFRHHYPYFGMLGEEDAKNLQTSFEETKSLYESLFGEAYCPEDVGEVGVSKCHKGCSKCHKCSSGCGMTCKQCKSGQGSCKVA